MTDFAQARKNMVDCQLATSGVVTEAVLDAFSSVPRELFLSAEKQGAAYIDEDIPLNDNLFLMEPVIHARMLEIATPDAGDTVLNIGDMTGYSSAVLSALVSTVVVIEPQAGILDNARKVWTDLEYNNIAVVRGDQTKGDSKHAPYSMIFINGAVAEEPKALLEQLSIGGRLVAVIKKNGQPMGRLTVIKRIGEDEYSTRNCFDAATPYVPGFEPVSHFEF